MADRRQQVVVDGEVSNWKSVLSGVQQGSVLEPLLFLIYIYINDLDDNILERLKMMVINSIFKTICKNLSNGLKNGRCYSILGNINAYTQDPGTWM